jgi:hypothetical protein
LWQPEPTYGKPAAFYSDKHGVFRVNRKDAIGGDGMTQFGRAQHALNIHHLRQLVSGQGAGRTLMEVLFILEPTGIARSLARKRVMVIDYPDGRLAKLLYRAAPPLPAACLT